MTLELDLIVKVVVATSCIQYCYAQDHFGWYSQWYLWFTIVIIVVICCGICGSCLKRGKIQREIQNRRAALVSIALPADNNRQEGQTRIYYVPTSSPPRNQSVVHQVSQGATVPRQQSRMPATSNPEPTSPPPYEEVVDKQPAIMDPPTYQEAILQSGYVNPAATLTEDEGAVERSQGRTPTLDAWRPEGRNTPSRLM